MRIALTITAVILAGMMSGCCCGPVDCGSCDGGFVGYGGGCGVGGGCGPGVSCWNGFAQIRKAFVCGTGCGEAYMDEWCSTPPDACDPCCGDQFVGGATPCCPPCWYPGKALLSFLQCTGQRFCQFCNCVASQCSCGAYGGGCGPAAGGCCGDAGCGGGCGSNIMTQGAAGGEVINSGGGCATCSSNNVASGSRIATSAKGNPVEQQHYVAPAQNHRTARNTGHRGVSRAQSYHTRNQLYR